MAEIKFHNVVKRFGDIETIHGISLDIEDGEFVVFVGPSGCGKSTLLRLIAGLEEITDGEIHIDKTQVNDLDPAERGVAMVFQSYALYPHMTVAENMGFGLKMNGADKAEIKKRVDVAAKTLQLEPLLNRKPKDMSGGQRQRVAIGRAIVRDPKVFLFDEPLSNLDAELRVEMRLQIAKLHEALDSTMVYVTHDQVEAMTMADKIVVLRDGRVEQVGAPMDLYHRPANEFVAGFIGSPKMNFIPATVETLNDKQATITLPDKQSLQIPTEPSLISQGAKVKLGIRPEHIHIHEEVGGELELDFQSEVIERLGNSTFLFGQYAGVDGVKVQLRGDQSVERNKQLKLGVNFDHCHLFTDQGLSARRYSA